MCVLSFESRTKTVDIFFLVQKCFLFVSDDDDGSGRLVCVCMCAALVVRREVLLLLERTVPTIVPT